VNKGNPKEPVAKQIEAPLEARTLDFQTSLFNLAMKSHTKPAMEELKDKNPITKL
jgi:hypothetical protein